MKNFKLLNKILYNLSYIFATTHENITFNPINVYLIEAKERNKSKI